MKLNGKTWWQHDEKRSIDIQLNTLQKLALVLESCCQCQICRRLSLTLPPFVTTRGAAWRSMALCWNSWVRWVGRISEYLMRWAETDKLTGENWWADVCRVPKRAATAEKMNCMMKPCKNCIKLSTTASLMFERLFTHGWKWCRTDILIRTSG